MADDDQTLQDGGTETSRRARRREEDSPLAAVTGVQVAAHNFLVRRDEAAITENETDMVGDTSNKEKGSTVLGFVMTVIVCGACIALAVIRPYGRIDQSQIVAAGENHGMYVLVNEDGRDVLHPAWNLLSAQLITGSPADIATVKQSVLDSYPTGPKLGIPDAPQAITVHSSAESRWALCDTAPAASSDPTPTVTALLGRLTLGDRADKLGQDAAVLGEHAGSMYVVWGGHRSRVDLSNRALALALGIDSSAVSPVRISNALFDAIPATEALETPQIPRVGEPSGFDAGPGAVIGSVLKVSGLGGAGDELYVLLADGLQKVEPFTASLLLSSAPGGQVEPLPLAPKALARIPSVKSLRVDYYPPRRLKLINTRAFPVLCVGWSKGSTDRESVTTLISGKGLPIPVSADTRIARLVRNDRRPNSVEANQVWIDPAAANLAVVTNTDPGATSREQLWWISPQGKRYGISQDDDTLKALGLNPKSQAVQAPEVMVRPFAEGAAISRTAALVASDTVGSAPLAPVAKRTQ